MTPKHATGQLFWRGYLCWMIAASAALAQTQASGTINGATWTKANSSLHVVGDITGIELRECPRRLELRVTPAFSPRLTAAPAGESFTLTLPPLARSLPAAELNSSSLMAFSPLTVRNRFGIVPSSSPPREDLEAVFMSPAAPWTLWSPASLSKIL